MGRRLALGITLLAVGACGGESQSHESGGDGHRAGATSSAAGVGGTSGATNGAGGTSAVAGATSATGGAAGAGLNAPSTGGATATGTGGAERGGTSNAGSGGNSGTPAGSGAQGEAGANGASTVVIDDVDHNDTQAALPPGSAAFYWLGGLGNWFVTAPAPDPYTHDATPAEIVPPRGDSTKAYRVQDEGRERGVDLWAQLNHPGGKPVDLSAFAGITFWARLEGSKQQLRFGLNPGVSYFDAPDQLTTRTSTVSSEWKQYSIQFGDLGVDVHAIVSFDFIVGEGGDKFDFWLDDVGLFCDGPCPQQN